MGTVHVQLELAGVTVLVYVCRCIFVWRLSSDITKSMKDRLLDLGMTAPEASVVSTARETYNLSNQESSGKTTISQQCG